MSSRPTVLIPREPREQFEAINRFMNWAHNTSPAFIRAFPQSYRRDCSGIFIGDQSQKLFGQWAFDDKDAADMFLDKNMRYMFGDKPFDIFGKGIFASDRISVRLNPHDEPVPVDAFYVSLESVGQMHALVKKHQSLAQNFDVIESRLTHRAPLLTARSPLTYCPFPVRGHLYIWLNTDEDKIFQKDVSAVFEEHLGVRPRHLPEISPPNMCSVGYKDDEIDRVMDCLQGRPLSPPPTLRKGMNVFKGGGNAR